ncbi:hypothetical protein EV175_001868 [Coemansia sp. RSA 1933]|nr:hypothetical protein EV175_001868 [Coemansia sp. RSA 1933]
MAENKESKAYNDEFYALKFKTLEGKDYPFEQLRDKVVLVVNVASKCGFTPQYKGLEKMYSDNNGKGLVVLGFPSNQFGRQEPGGAEEIQTFCSTTYGVSFPIMEKSDVNGDNENPVFAYLKVAKPGLLGIKMIKWNFEKFVINRRGFVVERYASTTAPKDIESVVAKYLDEESVAKSDGQTEQIKADQPVNPEAENKTTDV